MLVEKTADSSATLGMTKGRATLPCASVAGGENSRSLPLRYAPVGMTILFKCELSGEIIDLKKPIRWKLWLAFAALGLVWGTTWVAASLTEQVPALLGSAARYALAALFLLPVIVGRRLKPPARPRPGGGAASFRRHDCAAVGDAPWGARPCAISNCGGVVCSDAAVGDPDDAFAGGQGRAADRDARGDRRPGRDCAGDGRFLFGIQAAGAAVVLLAVASTGASSLIARRELRSVSPSVVTALLLAGAAPLLFLASMVLERGQPAQWNGRATGAVVFLALVAARRLCHLLLAPATAGGVPDGNTAVGSAPGRHGRGRCLLRLRWSFSMIAGSLVTFLCWWWQCLHVWRMTIPFPLWAIDGATGDESVRDAINCRRWARLSTSLSKARIRASISS